MEHVYRFRIFPSLTQEEQIQETFACAMRAYNYVLEQCAGQKKLPAFTAIAAKLEDTATGRLKADSVDPAAVRDAAAAAFRDAAFFRAKLEKGEKALPPAKRRAQAEFRSCAVTPSGIVIGNGVVEIPYLGQMPCGAARAGCLYVLAARIEQGASGYFKLALRCSPDPPGRIQLRPQTGFSVSCFDPEDFEQELRRRRDKKRSR